MSRPEHLHCVNTAEGIMRINEEQAFYDADPERYERIEQQIKEERERDWYEQQQEFSRQEQQTKEDN